MPTTRSKPDWTDDVARAAGMLGRYCQLRPAHATAEEFAVITAIVLIDCATDAIPEVAEAIAELPSVTEVYSVAGGVDLIAVVRVREFDDIADAIAGGISKIAGVSDTQTHIAFRAYSKHDLEETFAIGLD